MDLEGYKFFNTDLLKEYLFKELVAEGLAPTEDEVEIIIDILFDFLIEEGLLIDLSEG